MHRPRSLIAEELSACIRCNECLLACPALGDPLAIETLNNETLAGPLSSEVARFARNCFQCGACVPVCPVGLHRDSMMLWLKMRLLGGSPPVPDSEVAAGGSRCQPMAVGGSRPLALPPSVSPLRRRGDSGFVSPRRGEDWEEWLADVGSDIRRRRRA